jgi:radical SAM superfamily enzyme YgiQ (UPF0313 family)
MKVLLIAYDNGSHISYFPAGLAYIASAVRQEGHYVEVYQQDIYHYSEEHLVNYIESNHFDAVGIGGCGGYYQYRKIKKIALAIDSISNKPFFWMGGHLPSPEPEYFLRKFKADVVMVGESDETVKEMLSAIDDKERWSEIKGIAFLDKDGNFQMTERRPLIKDIDNIPFPAYDLLKMEHYVLYPKPNSASTDRCADVLSGRGCPFRCNFCYRMDEGFRPRSSEKIIEEIEFLKANYQVTYIDFIDELLMSSVKRTKEFCKMMIDKNVNVKWACNGRLNFASVDTEMLELMKSAGCVFINYGIESMDNDALKRMNKHLTTDMIIKGIENTLAAGISPGLNIIFGNLGENSQSLKNDVEFLLKYDDHAQVRTIRPVTPYPGTDLYKIAIEKGLIKDIEDFYENKHQNSDLLTCNFTDLTDEEYYQALYNANNILLDNYLKNTKKINKEILDRLYIDKDVNFRGFRYV